VPGAKILRDQRHRGAVAAMARHHHEFPDAGACDAFAERHPCPQRRFGGKRLRAGTICSTEAALRTWMALGESVARTGIRKFVMVTSHGGNSAAMTLVAQDLRARHGMLAVTTGWSRFGAPEDFLRPKNCVTAFMAAQSKPRSCWRATANTCARGHC